MTQVIAAQTHESLQCGSSLPVTSLPVMPLMKLDNNSVFFSFQCFPFSKQSTGQRSQLSFQSNSSLMSVWTGMRISLQDTLKINHSLYQQFIYELSEVKSCTIYMLQLMYLTMLSSYNLYWNYPN